MKNKLGELPKNIDFYQNYWIRPFFFFFFSKFIGLVRFWRELDTFLADLMGKRFQLDTLFCSVSKVHPIKHVFFLSPCFRGL